MVTAAGTGAMLAAGAGRPLLGPAAMRAAEAATIAGGVPALALMERAAAAAVLAIERYAPLLPALILCGPGNNGGDGFAIACGLRAGGRQVRVAALGETTGETAATMAARWGSPVESLETAPPAPLIIDALFGTGLSRRLPPTAQSALDRLAGAGCVVAVDIASGIDGATGAALGRPFRADMTVTFAALKPGHVMAAGPAHSGRLVVADIGVAIESDIRLVTAPHLRIPPPDTHKYRRGAVVVIDGGSSLGGAARLSALAALRSGAGLVTLVGEGLQVPADAVMLRDDAAGAALFTDRRTGAIAIGPGMADTARNRDWLARALGSGIPAVIDAGALALLAAVPGQLAAATAPLVLTPHDGEFTTLFGAPGSDRIAASRAAAVQSRAIVVLKGSATIIAAPDGRVAINSHAAAWAATAGSGDVLTGIIAALLAQGLDPFDAACVAAWLHGDAAIRGGAGLIADDLPALLPRVFAAL
jgi:hydroxyethylthiazole kinase-like uncharacterized protein yjeF